MEYKIKTAWILTINAFEGGQEIYGVYANEDLANDAINDELFMDYLNGRTATDELVESFYADINPDIQEHQIIIKLK